MPGMIGAAWAARLAESRGVPPGEYGGAVTRQVAAPSLTWPDNSLAGAGRGLTKFLLLLPGESNTHRTVAQFTRTRHTHTNRFSDDQ